MRYAERQTGGCTKGKIVRHAERRTAGSSCGRRRLAVAVASVAWMGLIAPPSVQPAPGPAMGNPGEGARSDLEAIYAQPLTDANIEEIRSWRLADLDWWLSPERNLHAHQMRRRLADLRHDSTATLRSILEYEELFGLRVTAPTEAGPFGIEGTEGWVKIEARLRPDLFSLSDLIYHYTDDLLYVPLTTLRDPASPEQLETIAGELADDEETVARMHWLWRMLDLQLLPPLPGTGPGGVDPRVKGAAATFLLNALKRLYPELAAGVLATQKAQNQEWAVTLDILSRSPAADLRETWGPLVETAARDRHDSRESRCRAFLDQLPEPHRTYFLRFITYSYVRGIALLEEIPDHHRTADFFTDLDRDTRGGSTVDYLSTPGVTQVDADFKVLQTGMVTKKKKDIVWDAQGQAVHAGEVLVYTLGDGHKVVYMLMVTTTLNNGVRPYELTAVGEANVERTKDGMKSYYRGNGFSTFCPVWSRAKPTCKLEGQQQLFYLRDPGLYAGTTYIAQDQETNTHFQVTTVDVTLTFVKDWFAELGLKVDDVGAKLSFTDKNGATFTMPKKQQVNAVRQISPTSVSLCGPASTDPECCRLPQTIAENGTCVCPEGMVPTGEPDDPCVDVCERFPQICEPPEETFQDDYDVLMDEEPPDDDWWFDDSNEPLTPCVIMTIVVFVDLEIPGLGIFPIAVEREVCTPRSDQYKRLDCSDGRWWYLCDARAQVVSQAPPRFRCTPGEQRCMGEGGQASQRCGANGYWARPSVCAAGCDAATGTCGATPCADGDTRCAEGGAAMEICAGGVWGDPVLCAAGCNPATQLCTDDGSGDSCASGALRCVADDAALQHCEGGSWGTVESCDNGCDPVALACRPSGVPQCLDGERRCYAGGTRLQHCESGMWGSSQLCPFGCDDQTASCHVSSPTCPFYYPNRCDQLGRVVCSGGNLVICDLATDGCLTWRLQETCTSGCANNACLGGTCVGQDVCFVEDAARCRTTEERELCLADGFGCLRWTPAAVGPTCDASATEICLQGLCVEQPCSVHADCQTSSRSCQAGYCAPCSASGDCGTGYHCQQSTGRCLPNI